MLTKRNVCLLLLSTIILIVGIYYVISPNEKKAVSKELDTKDKVQVTVKESDELNALKVSRDDTRQKEMDKVKAVLNDDTKSSDEKNDAYETLKRLTTSKGKETNLEKLIEKNFNYKSFVNIDNDKVKVVVSSKKHSYDLASKIITTIEREFDGKIYVTVEFDK